MDDGLAWAAPGDLEPWERNPRRNDDSVDGVVESIRRFGFGAPIVARQEDGRIIAGHTRWKAARKMGLESVPVRYMRGLSDDEAAALALADNRLTEATPWDDVALADVLRDLGDLASGLGWTDEELALRIDGADAVGEDEWSNALGDLPAGDRAPIQQMAFTLHDDQVAQVKAALAQAKALGDFGDTGNANSNGNALARICELWMGRRG